jgi:hypothetical protein
MEDLDQAVELVEEALEEEEFDVQTLTLPELRHIAWLQLGLRVSERATAEEIHALLVYKGDRGKQEKAKINRMRDTLMTFIQENERRLSIPCNGNCYQHPDGIVAHCYEELLEDNPDRRP